MSLVALFTSGSVPKITHAFVALGVPKSRITYSGTYCRTYGLMFIRQELLVTRSYTDLCLVKVKITYHLSAT